MSPSSSGVSSLGTSWTCSSPCLSLTPPFPLPATGREDECQEDGVEALLQLSDNSGDNERQSDTDEGIVSDQSNEFETENNKRLKVRQPNGSFSLMQLHDMMYSTT